MREAALHVSDSHDAHLEALAKAAAILDWPLPRDRDEAVCHEAARVIDALLVRVARGRGALDVALGEALEVLGNDGRVLDLGHSSARRSGRAKSPRVPPRRSCPRRVARTRQRGSSAPAI